MRTNVTEACLRRQLPRNRVKKVHFDHMKKMVLQALTRLNEYQRRYKLERTYFLLKKFFFSEEVGIESAKEEAKTEDVDPQREDPKATSHVTKLSNGSGDQKVTTGGEAAL